MTLTDEIYAELKNGLWTSLNYDGLRLKYEKNKSSFYNALQMVLADASAEMTKLSSELKALRDKGDEENAKLKSLTDQQEKAADETKARQQEIETLEGEEQAIKAKIQELSAELNARAGLLTQIKELEKVGFDSEKLQQLCGVIVEIGTKQGQKPGEAIGRFFNDLQDYDIKTGFEREVQRLETITGTKKLEADKWQAEADSLSRRHKDLSEAITAVQSLTKQRVNVGEIVSWNEIVSKLGGPVELQDKLRQYKSMSELLNARKEEVEAYGLRLTEIRSQVETLEKERAKIEAGIDALKVAGVKELRAMTEEAAKQLKAVAAAEIREARAVGQEIRSEFSKYFTQIDQLAEKAFQMGQTLKELEQKLQKYEEIKNILDSHAVAMEEAK